MDMFQVNVIKFHIKNYGGFREKDILKNLVKIELIEDNKYNIYRFYSADNKYFDYAFSSNKIVS